MLLLDFEATPAESFRHGFMKGLAAPVMIFGGFRTPKPIDVITVQGTSQQLANPFVHDWMQVANDVNVAVVAYGKTK